jgi:hypothetical protein
MSLFSSMSGMAVGVAALAAGFFGAKKARVYVQNYGSKNGRRNYASSGGREVEIERGSGGTRLAYS